MGVLRHERRGGEKEIREDRKEVQDESHLTSHLRVTLQPADPSRKKQGECRYKKGKTGERRKEGVKPARAGY